MAAHGPLTRPLPTVLQSVDFVSGKHRSTLTPPASADSESSIHHSVESWFHGSSSSNSSFSVHPSIPPLPKGARAPSPQPSPSRSVPPVYGIEQHSPAAPQTVPRQGYLPLSWSFEWRGISKMVKWALHPQNQKPTVLPQPSQSSSTQFTNSTVALGIPEEADITEFIIGQEPQGAHIVGDRTAPQASLSNSSSRVDLSEDRYHSRAQSEQGHNTRSNLSNSSMYFPSISEVHLPRSSMRRQTSQQPYLQIMPSHRQHVRRDSVPGHDLSLITEYNNSTLEVDTRKAFSDCGHSNYPDGRVSWVTTGFSSAYSDLGHGASAGISPSYASFRQEPQTLLTSSVDFPGTRLSAGVNVFANLRSDVSGQSMRSSKGTVSRPRKLRKNSRARRNAASQLSLVTKESLPRSKALPPTPPLSSETYSPTITTSSQSTIRPRKLTKRRTTASTTYVSSLQSLVHCVDEPSASNSVAALHQSSSTQEDRIRPSFLRSDSNRRWTVSVADVPDDLLIEELERLRRLGMRAGEVHGDPSRSRVQSLQGMHTAMSEEHVAMDESADVSEVTHEVSGLEEEQEWVFARRAILCCRELVRTERTYQERLQDLARNQVSDSVPPLALHYLPALIAASNALNKHFANDPSACGVSMGFLDVQNALEPAFVAWCGVVGEFFSNDPRGLDISTNRAAKRTRVAQAPARKPSVLKRRLPSTAARCGRVQARSVSVPDHAIMAWSSGDGDVQIRQSAVSDISGLPLSSIQEADQTVEKTALSGFARSLNVNPIRGNKKRHDSCKPPFRDIAILPTQRVTRYVLLFKDLLKHTPMMCPTRDVVQRALDGANNLAMKCNRAQGNANFLYEF